MTSQYFQLAWILPIFGLFYKSHFKINGLVLCLVLVTLMLGFFVIFMSNLSNESFFESPHFFNVIKSLFILLISYNFAFFEDVENFTRNFGWISLFAGIVLCFGVYNHSFAQEFDINSRVYAYANKNSVSQIILSSIVFSFFLIPKMDRLTGVLVSVLKLSFILFGVYLLFLLKSRATILGMVFFVFMIFSRRDIMPKLILIALLFFLMLVIVSSSQFRNILFLGILFAGRNVNDINDASSGRMDFYIDFPKLFLEHPFTGHGFVFSESFPLSVLLDYGIVGGVMVFLFVFAPIFYSRQIWFSRNNDFAAAFISIALIYFFNSIFEQQAPLGPGAKNFLLWSTLGFILKFGKQNRISKIGKESISQ